MSNAKQQIVEHYYRNKTKHCSIGLSPEQLKSLGRLPDHPPAGKPWLHPTRKQGGEDWFLPPDGVWADKAWYYNIMTQGVYNLQMFVHCTNEAEFAELQAAHPELVDIRDGKDLKGFFGASYVLEDVTHLHDEILNNAVSMISGRDHVNALKAELIAKENEAARAKDETDKVKAEFERMKIELSLLKNKSK